MSAAPGWYPDPESPGVVRWWDGAAWTGRRAPMATAPQQPQPDVAGGVATGILLVILFLLMAVSLVWVLAHYVG